MWPGAWRWPLVMSTIGLVLMLIHIWTRLQVVSVGYALSDTRHLFDALESERQALAVEWETQTASARLTEKAVHELGLRSPEPEQVIRLR